MTVAVSSVASTAIATLGPTGGTLVVETLNAQDTVGVVVIPAPVPPPPPADPSTTLQNVIRAYLYTQYNDDDDLQAFVSSYNAYAQGFLNWFNGLNLPVYTYGGITGLLLDWVGAGLYGYPRPGLPSEGTAALGPFNTWMPNTLAFNTFVPAVNQVFYSTSDDIYKRLLTWMFYKGDGQVINVRWLKRRVERFLHGANGADVDCSATFDVSVVFTGPRAVTIALPNTPEAVILNAAIDGGILEVPFQITWTVTAL